MKIVPYISLILFIGLSCKTGKRDSEHKPLLDVTVQNNFSVHSRIMSAYYIDGHFLLNTFDGLVVMDTSFLIDSTLTAGLAGMHLVRSGNDTIMLYGNRRYFYLYDSCVPKKLKKMNRQYRHAYFDETYDISAGCFGEFGGAVFFFNKKTGRIHYLPGSCVVDYIKLNGKYIIASYLGHMGNQSYFVSIKDPEQLFEITKNEYEHYYEQEDWAEHAYDSLPQTVRRYFDKPVSLLMNFEDSGQLYTVYCTDSATILGRHINDSLVVIDTLLRYPIAFHSVYILRQNDFTLASFNGSYALGSDSFTTQEVHNGLALLKGRKLSIVKFDSSYTHPLMNH